MNLFHINHDNTIEPDKIFLCNRQLQRLSEIYPVEGLKLDMHMNSNWEVSFTIHRNNNGIEMPNWDKIDDLAIIEVENKGLFEIAVPKTSDTSVYKAVNGISLGEAETGQTKITLQINTKDDTAREEYTATILYHPEATYDKPDGSLLHRIFQSMPHYQIGYIDESVASQQRTFSCDNTTVYDFLQQIAEELECIFVFDRFERKVNCYQLEGYGKDSGVFIDDTRQLAETITVTGDKDSVKNYFKIEGGDDVITNRLGSRMIGGNYLWKPSDYQLSQMSEELREALSARNQLISSNQKHYNDLWEQWSRAYDQKGYYQSGMMPGHDTDDTTAESVCNEIFGRNGKIAYGCIRYDTQNPDDVARSLTNYAKIIAPDSYTVELQYISGEYTNDIITSISFKVHVYLTGQFKEDGKTLLDEYTSDKITLPVKNGTETNKYVKEKGNVFTTDYYLYLKQALDMAVEKSESSESEIIFEPKVKADYDSTADPSHLPYNHYTKYCIDRLDSFYDAYEACSQVIAKLNADIPDSTQSKLLQYITINGSQENIYEALLGKYNQYMKRISKRKQYLQTQVDVLNTTCESLQKQIDAIREQCDMRKFLERYSSNGEKLWKELCSFRREDTYKNENYIGQDVGEVELMENIDKLLERAEEEIDKAREMHYSISTTISNLLLMPEFEPFWDKFDLGSYIRIRFDNDIYKLRLISISCDYSDISHLGVEFSDVIKERSDINDFSQILQQAGSMATSFNFVSRQAENGEKAKSTISMLLEEGLNVANTTIKDAKNQTFEMNEYGITGREWDDYRNEFKPEQIRVINNLLCFTDDAWEHTRTALGKVWWNGQWSYGLLAEVLVGKLIAGKQLTIENSDGSVKITGDGIDITKGTITWNNINSPEIKNINNLSTKLSQIDTDIQDAISGAAADATNKANAAESNAIKEAGNLDEKLQAATKEYTSSSIKKLDDKVKGYLGMSGGTVIGEKYVISPYIGGGYLSISDINGTDKQVIIDPSNLTGNNCVFQVHDKKGNVTIGADAEGNAMFKGTIYATSGEFTGEIMASSISGSTIEGSTIICGNNFEVNETGEVIAKAINIEGGTVSLNTSNSPQNLITLRNLEAHVKDISGNPINIKFFAEGAPSAKNTYGAEIGDYFLNLSSNIVYQLKGRTGTIPNWQRVSTQPISTTWYEASTNTQNGFSITQYTSKNNSVNIGGGISVHYDGITMDKYFTGPTGYETDSVSMRVDLVDAYAGSNPYYDIGFVFDHAIEIPKIKFSSNSENSWDTFAEIDADINGINANAPIKTIAHNVNSAGHVNKNPHISLSNREDQVAMRLQLITGIYEQIIGTAVFTLNTSTGTDMSFYLSTPGITDMLPYAMGNGDYSAVPGQFDTPSINVIEEYMHLQLPAFAIKGGQSQYFRVNYSYWRKAE